MARLMVAGLLVLAAAWGCRSAEIGDVDADDAALRKRRAEEDAFRGKAAQFLAETRDAATRHGSFAPVALFLSQSGLTFRKTRIVPPDHADSLTRLGDEEHVYVPDLDATFVRLPKYNWILAVIPGDSADPTTYAVRVAALADASPQKPIPFGTVVGNFPDLRAVDTIPPKTPLNVSGSPETAYFSPAAERYFVKDESTGMLVQVRKYLDPSQPFSETAPFFSYQATRDLDRTPRPPSRVWEATPGDIKSWLQKSMDKSKKTYLGTATDE